MKDSSNMRSFSCKVKNIFVLLVLSSQRLWGRISVWLDGWSWENVFRTLKPPFLSLLMFTFDKKKHCLHMPKSFHLMYLSPGIALVNEEQFFYSRLNTSLQKPSWAQSFYIVAVIWSSAQTCRSKTFTFKLNVVQLVVVKPFFRTEMFVCVSVCLSFDSNICCVHQVTNDNIPSRLKPSGSFCLACRRKQEILDSEQPGLCGVTPFSCPPAPFDVLFPLQCQK